MSAIDPQKTKKKERTIRSETTKVFLVIFFILASVGIFTIAATINGARTFNSIKGIYLQQFQAAEIMKQKSLDIIGIFYLLAGDQDIDLQMEQMQRYDGLVSEFEKSRASFETLVKEAGEGPESKTMLELLAKTKEIFDLMNNNCREMTIGMMDGRKDDAKVAFGKINKDIAGFKQTVDTLESIVGKQLTDEANRAQSLLRTTSYVGIGITFLAIFVTIGLITYLMKFLSISLLPISNLMHNMRQAVFSIDRSFKITAPVSHYSNTVFGEDIVGKDVMHVAYRDLDPKSEALAGAKTALLSSFGEDDVQWMLAEDSLPAQVSRVDAKGQNKILKLTYTPLWNKQSMLENIMIVAEDVTEIEALRAEAIKKQGEVAIIQSLFGIDKTDLEVFLIDSGRMLKECQGFSDRLEQDPEARNILFRHLHTIKGNSRLYNLNTISEIVHGVEASVVDMNKRFDSKEPVPSEVYASLENGLAHIEETLAVHSRTAQKLFGIKDVTAGRKEDQLHHNLTAIELSACFPSLGAQRQKSGLGLRRLAPLAIFSIGLEKVTESAQEAATYLGADKLAKALEEYKLTQAAKDPLASEQALIKVQDLYKLSFGLTGKSYDMDPGKWISVIQKIYELSLTETGTDLSVTHDALLEKMESQIASLYAIADAEGLRYIRALAVKLMLDITANPEQRQPSVQESIRSLWSYLGTIFCIDASFALDHKVRPALITAMSALPESLEQALKRLHELTGAKVLLLSFLRAMGRGGVHPYAVLELVGQRTGLEQKELIQLVFGSDTLRTSFDTLAQNLASEFPIGTNKQALHSLTSGMAQLHKLMAHQAPYGILSMDLLRVLAKFTRTGRLGVQENTQQFLEISAQQFQRIQSLATALSEGSPNHSQLTELNKLIRHAFDYPVKTLCSKMEAMVGEVSKRLDKEVVFRVTGEDIAIERDRAYALRDALVHLIRNSLDHGIEKSDERTAQGKTPQGTLEIRCSHRPEGFAISIRDDGRGIDYEKVAERAVAIGTITPAQASRMSPQDKMNLIFTPRLTTKDEVSTLSGRGVGMDAVKSTLEEMGGSVSIQSQAGKGSEFNLLIPFLAEDSALIKSA